MRMKRSEEKAKDRIKRAVISPNVPISEVIPILDKSGLGMLLVCEDDMRLVGILTDGDIRRAILTGISFDQPVSEIASKDPVVAHPGVPPAEALHIMDHARRFIVNHLPLVDQEGRLVDLLLRRDLVREDPLDLSAVIMAGGQGSRLRPLTEDLPKPMLPIGDRPLMERTVEQLRQSGIRRVSVTTHYLPEKIEEYFGDGEAFGVEMDYVAEDRPLGTAGALRLLEKPELGDEPLLVINGDILTRVDFRAMLAFHNHHAADLTVGVRRYELRIPFGVIKSEGAVVNELQEKPTHSVLVNAGVYLLQPAVLMEIPADTKFDMTDMIMKLIGEGRRVVNFPIVEYWLDIGQQDDYEQAQKDVQSGRAVE